MIKVVNSAGATPLHVAAGVSFLDGVLYLIKMGADVTVKDKNKQTPLSLANAQIRKAMNEAIVNMKDHEGKG